MESLIQKLEVGKQSCHQMINMLNNNLQRASLLYDDNESNNNISYLKGIYDHFKVIQTTFDDALFMLSSYDFIQDINDSPNHFCKIEDKFGGEIPKDVAPYKDRRGSYKRRRSEEAREIITMNLSDDGHAWRKYGQKPILHSTHPRNYYRCTHKYDGEGCQAMKQVQQISKNPPKYRILYLNQHTCKPPNTPNNNNPTILSNNDNQNSSILLSFDTTKQALNYPFLFPTCSSTTPPSSSSSSSSGVALLTGSSSIKEEVIAYELLNIVGGTQSNQYTSLTPDQYVGATTSSDVTAMSDNITGVISSTEVYSNVPDVQGVVIDECYFNFFDDDLIDLHDLYDG